MKSNLWLSVLLHIMILAATGLSSPFSQKQPHRFGEVIRINAVSPAELPVPKPEPIAPLEIPPAIEQPDLDIPIDDATTKPTVETEELKPEPEPAEPEFDPDPAPQRQIDTQEQPAEAESTDAPTEVESATGGEFAGTTVDNVNFDYPIWFGQAFAKISRNFRHGVQSDGSLVCTIYFQVLQSGRVFGLKVEQSSGYRMFDDACMEAVSRSAPFPPLPRDFRDEIIGITIPFTNL